MEKVAEIEPDKVEEQGIIAEEAPKPAVSADEGIEGLKKQLEAEKSRREAAERQAQEATSAAFRAKSETDETNLQLVSNAIETVKGNTASLRTAYADAMAKGDYTKAADIQMEMSSNAARLLQLETGRQAMVDKPKQAEPIADPVEALAKQLTPRSAAWVRAHPEYASGELYHQMVAAHNLTLTKKIPSDSDEYFRTVERFLDIGKPTPVADEDTDEGDGTEQAAKVVSRRSSPAAAPVSRSAPSSTGNPRVVRLTADEREMARLNKMTDQEYFEQKQRIGRDTRYN